MLNFPYLSLRQLSRPGWLFRESIYVKYIVHEPNAQVERPCIGLNVMLYHDSEVFAGIEGEGAVT